MFSRIKNIIEQNIPHFAVEVKEDFEYVITDRKINWVHIVHRTDKSGKIASYSDEGFDGCNTKSALYELTIYSLFDCYESLDFGNYLSALIDKIAGVKIKSLYTNPSKILKNFEGVTLRKKVKLIKIDFSYTTELTNCFDPCENLEKTKVFKSKTAS